MGTRLIIGAVFIVLGIIALAVCFLAARNPNPPKWASDTVTGSVILPLTVGALVMGPMLMGEALLFYLDSLSFANIMMALFILLAGVIILMLMRIPKRLAAYESSSSADEMEKKRGEGLRGRRAEAQLGS